MSEKMIFVVDDEPMLLRAYGRVIKSYTDHNVMVFNEPADLIHAVTDYRSPSLVITDFNMPMMNGDEMVAVLRSQGYDGPVLMISCAPGLRKPDGVDLLLPKPFGENQFLADKIDELLGV